MVKSRMEGRANELEKEVGSLRGSVGDLKADMDVLKNCMLEIRDLLQGTKVPEKGKEKETLGGDSFYAGADINLPEQ